MQHVAQRAKRILQPLFRCEPRVVLNVVEFGNTVALRPQGSDRYVDTGNANPRAATNNAPSAKGSAKTVCEKRMNASTRPRGPGVRGGEAAVSIKRALRFFSE